MGIRCTNLSISLLVNTLRNVFTQAINLKAALGLVHREFFQA